MHKKSLLIIFLVVFIDLLGFGMVIPILPYYAKSFGASAITLGFLMMSYSGMQFLFAPFWGQLSDRIGRKPVLMVSILGIGLSMLLLSFAHSLFFLFLGRILAGFFGANISAASAYIADITPPEERARGMGLIGAAFGLGFLFGPALGGFLSQWGYGTAPLVASILALINFIFASFQLKEPPLTAESRKSNRNLFDFKMIRTILGNKKTGVVVLLFFLVTTGFAQLETTFAFFVLARFGLDAKGAGFLLALMALVMVGIQGGGIGKLAKTIGEKKLILIGTALMTLALILASMSYHLSLFIMAIFLQATGYALTNPSLSSLVSKSAEPGLQGSTMGIYQSAGSLARMTGPVIAGFLFEKWGNHAPFWGAAGLMGTAFLIHYLKNGISIPAKK